MHFSGEPVAEVYAVEQTARREGFHGPKPRGLWISDEDEYGWREWCVDNSFATERFFFQYEVTLVEEPNILMLGGADEIDDFTRRYGQSLDRLPDYFYYVDWSAVARKYNGILITPYIWSRRMTSHTSWYYGWDCASGCIWNPDAVASIRIVDKEDHIEEEAWVRNSEST